MKTLKILAVICIALAFSANNANCQKVTGDYTWTVTFYAGDCLWEDVTGDVIVETFSTKTTYHEKGRGVLTGKDSGDKYTLDFENNHIGQWHEKGAVWGYTFPMLLKHEGKLVAVIHESYRAVYVRNYGVTVLDRYVYNFDCQAH